MANLYGEVSSDFDLLDPGWYRVTVQKAEWKQIKNGPNAGAPRLALTYAVSFGEKEGAKLFDSCMFRGKGASFGKRKLETVAPEVDWTSYEFPDGFDDADGIERLSDTLVGRDLFAKVAHAPRLDDATRMAEEVKAIAGADAEIESVN